MSNEHAPGTLLAGSKGMDDYPLFINDADAPVHIIGTADTEGNANRLVACWNACEGVETEILEQYPAPFSEMRDERDALLEALTNIERLFSEKCSASCMTQADLQAIEESRSMIAKAKWEEACRKALTGCTPMSQGLAARILAARAAKAGAA